MKTKFWLSMVWLSVALGMMVTNSNMVNAGTVPFYWDIKAAGVNLAITLQDYKEIVPSTIYVNLESNEMVTVAVNSNANKIHACFAVYISADGSLTKYMAAKGEPGFNFMSGPTGLYAFGCVTGENQADQIGLVVYDKITNHNLPIVRFAY